MGRRNLDHVEVKRKIIEGLIDGLSFRAACEAAGIKKRMGYYWLRDDPDFLREHDIAREIQADDAVDEIAQVYAKLNTNSENFMNEFYKARLTIDSIKWTAGKQRPKKYGNNIQHEVAGVLEHQHVSKEQRDAAVAAAIESAKR